MFFFLEYPGVILSGTHLFPATHFRGNWRLWQLDVLLCKWQINFHFITKKIFWIENAPNESIERILNSFFSSLSTYTAYCKHARVAILHIFGANLLWRFDAFLLWRLSKSLTIEWIVNVVNSVRPNNLIPRACLDDYLDLPIKKNKKKHNCKSTECNEIYFHWPIGNALFNQFKSKNIDHKNS